MIVVFSTFVNGEPDEMVYLPLSRIVDMATDGSGWYIRSESLTYGLDEKRWTEILDAWREWDADQ